MHIYICIFIYVSFALFEYLHRRVPGQLEILKPQTPRQASHAGDHATDGDHCRARRLGRKVSIG